jgi:pimeloyl-ACP methyl ester carboxylesterase
METAARHGITVELMSGVGHFVMLEDPDTFNRFLDNAVRRIVLGAME